MNYIADDKWIINLQGIRWVVKKHGTSFRAPYDEVNYGNNLAERDQMYELLREALTKGKNKHAQAPFVMRANETQT